MNNATFINRKKSFMKKTNLVFILVIFSISSICQQTEPSPTLTKDHYLEKSKNNKTAAWVFLGGGAAMVITGLAISEGDPEFNILCLCYVGEHSGTKGLLIAGGVLSMGASVFFFKSATKAKRRAVELAFKNESAPRVMQNGFTYQRIPSLNLKINL